MRHVTYGYVLPSDRVELRVMFIRDAAPADFPTILALNHENVHFLSLMDAARLRHLDSQSAYHRVLVSNDIVVGFLLAMREAADYDSVNFQWFARAYPEFLYIDRIALARAAQGQGLARTLYEDLFAFARKTGVARVTCEFDVEPPNPRSERFHRSFGFTQVGTQRVASGQKSVSLQVVEIR
jgi:uncharacterized protein